MLPVFTKLVGRTLSVLVPLTVPTVAVTVTGVVVAGDPTATAAPGFVASSLICAVVVSEALQLTAWSCWVPPEKVPAAMKRW
jgi:hypothetical protein